MEKTRKKRRPIRIALGVLGSLVGAAVVGACCFVYYLGVDNPSFYEGRVTDVENRFDGVYPKGSVVLVGSSYFERWKTSEEDLAPLDTVNVGIGGTKIGDHIAYMDRLVAPFDPEAVVIYAGSNDINGLPFFSKSGPDVAARVEKYLENMHEAIPSAKLFYVAITEAPQRASVRADIQEANNLIAEYARASDFVTFIDTAPTLLTPAGEIDATLFAADNLHFNEKGYEEFTSAIRPVLLGSLK